MARGYAGSKFDALRNKSLWPATASPDTRDASWGSPGVAVDDKGIQGGGKRIILRRRPKGAMRDRDFECVQEPVPDPGEDECVVQNIYVSLDPTHRIWASDATQYMPAVGLNTVMRAGTVGKVVKSSNERKLRVGTMVSCMGGVQEHAKLPIAACNPVMAGFPLTYSHSIFSVVIGLTAWVGTNICEPKAGDTMVVSAASGAVGSIAAQLAKLRGAKVIGIAGTPEKCTWLKEECGLDGCINYKTENLAEKLDELCPEGVDAYFDNVGGPTLETMLGKMNNFGRVAFCGSISGYNDGVKMKVDNYEMILMRRLKVQGFVCVDHLADFGLCLGELMGYVAGGHIKIKEHVAEAPIEDYVKTVNLLYSGQNTGKLMMKIAEE